MAIAKNLWKKRKKLDEEEVWPLVHPAGKWISFWDQKDYFHVYQGWSVSKVCSFIARNTPEREPKLRHAETAQAGSARQCKNVLVSMNASPTWSTNKPWLGGGSLWWTDSLWIGSSSERSLFSSALTVDAIHTSTLSRLGMTWPGIALKCIPGLLIMNNITYE